MERLTTTPFGARPLSYAQFTAAKTYLDESPEPVADKWALLRDLTAARRSFGVTDRDLTVLSALISFAPGQELDAEEGLIVFPSNATLSERAHGMAESTLRRHLAALSAAGLILRHDSPNGKRYAIRDGAGGIDRAFGFDLTPLVVRAGAISAEANAARAEAMRMKALRERISLTLRDLDAHAAFAAELARPGALDIIEAAAAFRRRFRRKLAVAELEALKSDLEAALRSATSLCDRFDTQDMDGNDIKNERHHSNSKPYPYEFEPCLDKQGQIVRSDRFSEDTAKGEDGIEGDEPAEEQGVTISLTLVKAACQEIALYADGDIRTWHDLIGTAAFVRGMLGISKDAWEDAMREMGPATAAIAIACILERSQSVRSPGGYLRALTNKAGQGAFSPGPMVMAILNTRETEAA